MNSYPYFYPTDKTGAAFKTALISLPEFLTVIPVPMGVYVPVHGCSQSEHSLYLHTAMCMLIAARTSLVHVLITALLPLAASQTLYSVSYSTSYDVASSSVGNVMCGSQLASEGYTTYGTIPMFPSLCGSANVTDSSSTLCGQCVVFEFAGNFAGVKLIGSAEGSDFVVSEEAMNALTNNVTIYPHVNARIVEGPYDC